MEDVKYIEDAEVISENIDTPVETQEVDHEWEERVREWKEMYEKMHTPFKREYRKIGRNEICPFCDSGLKFKHCECSQTYGEQTNY